MMSGWSRNARRRTAVVVVGLVVLALAWHARHSLLVGAAELLVREDPVAPADIIVISNSLPVAAAFEAALLYQNQPTADIVMAQWIHDPLVAKMQHLGIPHAGTAEMNRAILELSGVPSSAIVVLPDEVSGTESEISTLATFVGSRHPTSVLVITARSHTARTHWLLRQRLPDRIRVSVRSPRFDTFSVQTWWRERDQSREVMEEYLRWFNTGVLRDWWSTPPSDRRRSG